MTPDRVALVEGCLESAAELYGFPTGNDIDGKVNAPGCTKLDAAVDTLKEAAAALTADAQRIDALENKLNACAHNLNLADESIKALKAALREIEARASSRRGISSHECKTLARAALEQPT